MGGGFFDNMWDPYSRGYAYPGAQPRPRYYRPRAPVYGAVPEDTRSSYKVEEPAKKKTVKTIPVTDGGAPVAQVPVKPAVAMRFESEDAAATKIQTVYRGYVVRKTQPLKHLRVIKKVKEELETFKVKLQETEQRKKLCSESQERLRWTEGVMALLLRLDSLQGVNPEVRLIRKALTKELIRFQETIDSMSTEMNGHQDVITTEDSELAKDQTKVMDNTPPEGMELEEGTLEELSGVGQDLTSGVVIEVRESDSNIEATEDSTCGIHVPQVHLDIDDQVMNSVAAHDYDDQSGTFPGLVEESMIGEGPVVEPSSTEAHDEVPMDVETKEQVLTTEPPHPVEDVEVELANVPSMEPPHPVEDVEVELANVPSMEPPHPVEDVEVELANVPSTDIESDNQEAPQVDIPVESSPSRDDISEAISGEDASVTPAMNDAEMCEQAADIGRREEAENMLEQEAGRPALDTFESGDASAHQETIPECAAQGEGCMIPASNLMQSMSTEPQCLQVGQPQPFSTDAHINGLSDRALLLQVLEENRKLKDVVGKVLQWGKQQNDVIHNLASRVEQLEEHQHPSKLLNGEENDGRKKITNGRRSEKRRRSGKNRPQLGYIDSEDWLSAESDEYF